MDSVTRSIVRERRLVHVRPEPGGTQSDAHHSVPLLVGEGPSGGRAAREQPVPERTEPDR